MPKFSKRSLKILELVDSDLRKVLVNSIQITDFRVVCGHRGEDDQNKAYSFGKSKLPFPKSKHNKLPAKAVDIVPYPVDWNDLKRFYYLAGVVKACAENLGIKIRWGGDFNRDGNLNNDNFIDLPHFELDT